VLGIGSAAAAVTAFAGLGKSNEPNEATSYTIDICTQAAGGGITQGPAPVQLVFPNADSAIFVQGVPVSRAFTITRGTTYTIGVCIQITAGSLFDQNTGVQGYVLAF
jgi:hypothetical protein